MILVRSNDTAEYLPIIDRYRNSSQPVLAIGITNQLIVYDTGKNDIDRQICQSYKAIIIPYISNGGSAISNIGDIGVYFGIKGKYFGWCKYVRGAIKQWLMAQGISPHEENNDLTIHGKKVLGYTEHPGAEYSSGSIFIAMTNSQELVNKICKKPKTRKTAGLNDYGITANEISEVIIQATKDYLSLVGVKED